MCVALACGMAFASAAACGWYPVCYLGATAPGVATLWAQVPGQHLSETQTPDADALLLFAILVLVALIGCFAILFWWH